MKKAIFTAVTFGLISGIITLLLLWFVFPSGWFFLIIPAMIGWGMNKFATYSSDVICNEDIFEASKRKMGLICGAIVLTFVLITLLPLMLIASIGELLLSIPFIVISIISVYWGYKRGVESITDAFYNYTSENYTE